MSQSTDPAMLIKELKAQAICFEEYALQYQKHGYHEKAAEARKDAAKASEAADRIISSQKKIIEAKENVTDSMKQLFVSLTNYAENQL